MEKRHDVMQQEIDSDQQQNQVQKPQKPKLIEIQKYLNCYYTEQTINVAPQAKLNLYHPALINHIGEGLILISAPSQNFEKNQENLKSELAEGYTLNKLNQENKGDLYNISQIEWSQDQEKDENNPHIERSQYQRSVVINERLYIFSTASKISPVKVFDFNMKRMFPITFPKFGPSITRINYSIANFKHKVYLYGGLDDQAKIIDTMDEFDASTYKFTQVKYRLDFKPKGRQAHCAVVIDQYNMFIIGGTYQNNFIDPQPIPADEMILNFDMDASTFQQISIKPLEQSDPLPNNLVNHSCFRLDPIHIGILWYDYEAQTNQDIPKKRIMKATIYDIAKYTWKDINLIGQDFPTFRFGHALLPFYNEQRLLDKVLIVGGVDQTYPSKASDGVSIQELNFKISHKFEQSGGSLAVQSNKTSSKQFSEDSLINDQISNLEIQQSQNSKKKKPKKKTIPDADQ
eukprot:403331930